MIDALMGKIRSLLAILVALGGFSTGCAGEADAQKKRIRELEEELTRLQNTHDRLDERVTSLEVSRSVPQENTSKASQSAESEDPDRPQTAALERPPLKVFKLGPGASGGPPAAAAEEEPPGDDERGEPRPLIRGRGQHVEKAAGSPGSAGSKARGSNFGQNDTAKATQ
jgi:hypothetical protein